MSDTKEARAFFVFFRVFFTAGRMYDWLAKTTAGLGSGVHSAQYLAKFAPKLQLLHVVQVVLDQRDYVAVRRHL